MDKTFLSLLFLSLAASSQILLPDDPAEVWQGFHFNMSLFFQNTKCLTIIEEASNVSGDLDDFLLKYTNEVLAKDVYVYRPTLAGNVSNVYIPTNRTKGIVVLAIFESKEELNKALFVDRWKIFDQVATSVYVLVLKEDLCEETCLESLGDVLIKMWHTYDTADLLIFFSQSSKLYVFDPLKSKSRFIEVNGDNYYKHLSTFNTNLNGYALKVGFFERVPTSTNLKLDTMLEMPYARGLEKANRMGGIDAFLLATMVEYMNFSLIIIPLVGADDYGLVAANGSITGSLGQIVKGDIDISMNSRFMKLYGLPETRLSQPVMFDSFCLLCRKAAKIPNFIKILVVFTEDTWFTAAAVVVACAVVLCIFRFMFFKGVGSENWYVFLDMFLVFTGNPVKSPTLSGERLLIASLLLLNLNFISVFQGSLATSYTTIMTYKDINTLKEVADTGREIVSHTNRDIFPANTSTLMDRLAKKLTSLKHNAVELIESTNIFAVQRMTDARIFIELNYTDSEGFPILHVVEECPRSFYLSYLMRNKFAFIRHVNSFILRVNAAGLPEKWYDWTEFSMTLKHRYEHRISVKLFKELSLTDLQPGFYILIIGYTLSILAILLEFLHDFTTNRTKIKLEENNPQPVVYEFMH